MTFVAAMLWKRILEIEPTLYGGGRRCHARAPTYIWIADSVQRLL